MTHHFCKFAIFKAAALTLAVAATSASAGSITLCHDQAEQFPWIMLDTKGLNIVLLEMASAKAGVKLDFQGMPWKRCLSQVESGAIDGAIGVSYNDERAVWAAYPSTQGKPDPSKRIMSEGYSLYRVKGSTIGWNGSKFSNLKGPIGAQYGYSIVEDMKKWGADVAPNSYTPEALLRVVADGRLEAAALLTREGDFAITRPEFRDKLERVTPPLLEKTYFVVFGKAFYDKNRKAAEDFWNAIGAARESAAYKEQETAVIRKGPRAAAKP